MAIESLEVTTKTRDKRESMGNQEKELKLKRTMERGGTQRESSEERGKKFSGVREDAGHPKGEPFTRGQGAKRLGMEGIFSWSAQRKEGGSFGCPGITGQRENRKEKEGVSEGRMEKLIW
jgi:hypothetical protein